MATKKNLPNIPLYIGELTYPTFIWFKSSIQYKYDFKNCHIRGKWSKSSTIPKSKGIYAAELMYMSDELMNTTEIVYIGKASNLNKRLQSHNIISVLNKLSHSSTFLVRVWWFSTQNNDELEKQFISNYQPRLNVNYVN